MSLSKSLRQQEVREIGRYLFSELLGIRKTRECDQDDGKDPLSRILLKISIKILRY